MSSFQHLSIPHVDSIVSIALSIFGNTSTLAVLSNQNILLYDSNGQMIEGKAIQKKIAATVMAWHPA